MKKLKIAELKKGSKFLTQVEKLFLQFYDYMREKGLLLPLVKDGEKLWRVALEKTMGRFGILVVAIEKNNVIGFAHGTIRFSPTYLGGHKIGYVTHIFVLPGFRNRGIGKRLIARIEEWFRNNNANSYELQVLSNNDTAVSFWQTIGYKKELLQMRKIIKAEHIGAK